MRTEKQFEEEVMDSIYLNGSKNNDEYTLTPSQVRQVAREMWILHVEETRKTITEDRKNVAKHAEASVEIDSYDELSNDPIHVAVIYKDSIINAPQIELK